MKKALIIVIGVLVIAVVILSLVLTSAINNNQKLRGLFAETSGDKNAITNKFLELEGEKEKLVEDLENKTKESEEKYKLTSNFCTKTDCLFENEELVGLANLEGYYTVVEKKGYTGENEECDSFIVTRGNKNLMDHFKDKIEKGNTVNSINKEGNLVINIDLENLTKVKQNFIKNSDQEEKVSLSLIRETPPAIGVPVCSSFVNIWDVDEVEVE